MCVWCVYYNNNFFFQYVFVLFFIGWWANFIFAFTVDRCFCLLLFFIQFLIISCYSFLFIFFSLIVQPWKVRYCGWHSTPDPEHTVWWSEESCGVRHDRNAQASHPPARWAFQPSGYWDNRGSCTVSDNLPGRHPHGESRSASHLSGLRRGLVRLQQHCH